MTLYHLTHLLKTSLLTVESVLFIIVHILEKDIERNDVVTAWKKTTCIQQVDQLKFDAPINHMSVWQVYKRCIALIG